MHLTNGLLALPVARWLKGSIPLHGKVVHLTTVHSPFDGRIFHKECAALAGADYEVVLIAPYDGSNLRLNGIRVHSIPQPNGRLQRMTHTVWRALRAALHEKANCYHFHDPELIPAGLLLKVFGKRVVYDVHENVPDDVLNKTYLPVYCRKVIASFMRFIERFSSAVFDGIVAATPAIAGRFPADKTVTVQNFPIFGELVAKGCLPYAKRPHVIAYVGGMEANRGIEEMVRAMALVPENLQAQLALAGRFSPSTLEDRVKELPGWSRTDFLGWQSRNDVGNLLGRARAGLVLCHPVRSFVDSQPTKLFEYMSVGIPVIASDFPLWREIVEEAGCGLLVDPLDPNAIAKAIRWLIEHTGEAEQMGLRGLRATNSYFNWDSEAKKLLALYERLGIELSSAANARAIQHGN